MASGGTRARQGVACLFALPGAGLLLTRTGAERDALTSLDAQTLTIANYVGDASFALTGSLAAGIEGMDLFGCVVVGFITALGGGTLRDIALGKLPLFWMVNWDESLLCVLVAAAAFFLWPHLSHALRLDTNDEWLFWTDTVGLAAFAALGAHSATQVQPPIHFGACAVAGMFSATFGGLTRDVLCQKPPRILYSAREIYAIPALAGGAATTAVIRFFSSTMLAEAICLGFWVAIELRVLAVNHGIRLPTFPKGDVYMAAQVRMQRASFRSRIHTGDSLDAKPGLMPLLETLESPAGTVGSIAHAAV